MPGNFSGTDDAAISAGDALFKLCGQFLRRGKSSAIYRGGKWRRDAEREDDRRGARNVDRTRGGGATNVGVGAVAIFGRFGSRRRAGRWGGELQRPGYCADDEKLGRWPAMACRLATMTPVISVRRKSKNARVRPRRRSNMGTHTPSRWSELIVISELSLRLPSLAPCAIRFQARVSVFASVSIYGCSSQNCPLGFGNCRGRVVASALTSASQWDLKPGRLSLDWCECIQAFR